MCSHVAPLTTEADLEEDLECQVAAVVDDLAGHDRYDRQAQVLYRLHAETTVRVRTQHDHSSQVTNSVQHDVHERVSRWKPTCHWQLCMCTL